MSDSLKRAVDDQAASLGITQSELVREALVAYIAWHRALDAVERGERVENLRDPEYVAQLLGR